MKRIGVGMFIVTFVLMTGTVSWFNWWKIDGCLRYSIVAMQVLAVVLIAAGTITGRSRVDVTEDKLACQLTIASNAIVVYLGGCRSAA